MTLPSIDVRRVHDDDASFWHLECTACPFEGDEYEGCDVQDAIDAHLAEHDGSDQ